ncbi:MAG: nuclear transport factor 2 family protein [Gammaproteobacteria bacterium]|nr:nuclear transport factor 2 family protein [Gammaproteobacteria bacterium]
MVEHSLAEIARKYVESSNAHDLEAIEKMFLENASYESAYVGRFEGWESIAVMMREFFERLPDVEWQVDGINDVEVNVVEFPFVMRGTDSRSGERVERRGVERIHFTDAGRICHVEVR